MATSRWLLLTILVMTKVIGKNSSKLVWWNSKVLSFIVKYIKSNYRKIKEITNTVNKFNKLTSKFSFLNNSPSAFLVVTDSSKAFSEFQHVFSLLARRKLKKQVQEISLTSGLLHFWWMLIYQQFLVFIDNRQHLEQLYKKVEKKRQLNK